MLVTKAAMPSHLCRRYILSSPPNHGSMIFGRAASIMQALITPMAITPLYCMNTLRNAI